MPYVTVRAYRDPVEAEVARSHLELEGIPSLIVDDDLVAMQWQYSFAVGGVKLRVDEADLARAEAVLSVDRSGDLVALPESSDESDAIRCPECGATEVEASTARRRWAALSLLSGLPLVFGCRRWICRRCRHAWARSASSPIAASASTLEAERRVQRRSGRPIGSWIFLAVLGVAYFLQLRHEADTRRPPSCSKSVSECEAERRDGAATAPRRHDPARRSSVLSPEQRRHSPANCLFMRGNRASAPGPASGPLPRADLAPKIPPRIPISGWTHSAIACHSNRDDPMRDRAATSWGATCNRVGRGLTRSPPISSAR